LIQRKVANGYRAVWAAQAEAYARTTSDTVRLIGVNSFKTIIGAIACSDPKNSASKSGIAITGSMDRKRILPRSTSNCRLNAIFSSVCEMERLL
jgi:hypothetical protein